LSTKINNIDWLKKYFCPDPGKYLAALADNQTKWSFGMKKIKRRRLKYK